jgi:hypothetical protein
MLSGSYYGKVDDNRGSLGTWLARCRTPIFLRLTRTVEVGRDSAKFDVTGKELAKLCRSCDAVELD